MTQDWGVVRERASLATILDWFSSCDELVQPSAEKNKETHRESEREKKSTADESEEADSDVIHQPLPPSHSLAYTGVPGYSGQTLFLHQI